jgi:hypothetical protein
MRIRGKAVLKRALGMGALLVAANALTACNDCDEEWDQVVAFLDDPANHGCATVADCAVVSTGCRNYKGGICNTATMSDTAAASSRWKQLSGALSQCEDSCDQCLAAPNVVCVHGQCSI